MSNLVSFDPQGFYAVQKFSAVWGSLSHGSVHYECEIRTVRRESVYYVPSHDDAPYLLPAGYPKCEYKILAQSSGTPQIDRCLEICIGTAVYLDWRSFCAGVQSGACAAGIWQPEYELERAGVSILSVPLMASVYLPLFYWLGPKGAQYVNTAFFLGLFFGIMNLGGIIKAIPGLKTFVLGTEGLGLEKWLVGGAIYILFVAASYLVSLRLFSSRDL